MSTSFMKYGYIQARVLTLFGYRNLEQFIWFIKPKGMLWVFHHMLGEMMGENWQKLSLPTQFN